MTDQNTRPPASARLPRRRLILAGVVAAGTAGFVLTLAGFLHQGAVGASTTRPAAALTVTVAIPRHVAWPLVLEASGAIAAWQEASIGAQIGGYRLLAVRANVGDQVRKGQVLAELDPDLLRADEAQLKAAADQADANRTRTERIRSSGAVSDQDVLQFVTQAKAADAALEAKRLQLRYTFVRAPDNGAISGRSATLGAVTSVGQELFRLIRENRLEWRGELTAAQLTRVRAGEEIVLTLPDGSEARARVRQTAPSMDGKTRLGLVYADIPAGSTARAGMYANGQLAWGQTGALVVPGDCVIVRDGRSYVVKLANRSAHPTVVLQEVTVGRRRGREVEIAGGLSDADRVVEQGAAFLNDGDVVRVAQPATQSTGRIS
jgi:RND family efflux transporter MFP subunit